MSFHKDINRVTANMKNKIFSIFARGMQKLIDDSAGTQKIQVVVLNGETITDVERMQEYGFSSVPLNDAETVIGFINGSKEQGLILCVNDRRYRPTGLADGDVIVYDYRGNKITCKDSGIELECVNGNKIEMVSGEVKVNGTNLEVLI